MKTQTYIIRNDHIWKQAVASVKHLVAMGSEVRVRIDTKPHPKSERQLGYVWSCLYPYLQKLFEHETHEKISLDDIHQFHIELFNERNADSISKVVNIGFLSVGPRIIKSSMSSWGASSMSLYIEWLLRFYALRNIELPEADRYWKERGVKHGIAA